MKRLTYNELLAAPIDVQHLFVAAMLDKPVGSTIMERAIENHPEYFPEERFLRDNKDKIPDEVHAAYWERYNELMNSKPGFFEQNNDEWTIDEFQKKLQRQQDDLFDEFYGKYREL
jgi:hypothetical protein